MIESDSREGQQNMPTGSGPAVPRAAHLLVVEPEALLRWSLVTYLGQWFKVLSAETKLAAGRILDQHLIDAVVLSDELSERAMDDIESLARSRNPETRVVRTVTTERRDQPLHNETSCIEKPFELMELARLLGVNETNTPSD